MNRSLVTLSFALITGTACNHGNHDADLPDRVTVLSETIIGGKASTVSQNSVVLLQIGEEAICTGTLVAENLVLTARHCVSETDEGIVCGPDGAALSGGRVGADREAGDIVVYTGQKQSELAPRARGEALVHDEADNLCNRDIAFVVLDRPIDDVPVAALRTTESTTVGERITSVGWGLTKNGDVPKTRLQRTGVPILDVGPSEDTPSNEFVVGEAICSGDSGGPALSEQGAVIGVVSNGGNGQFDPDRPELGCVGPDTTNTYTRLAPFDELIAQAFELAGAEPTLESDTDTSLAD